MGMFSRRYRSWSTYEKVPPSTPNPNPNNFRVIRYSTIGTSLIVEVFYPDCTNYEGRKILVYTGVNIKELIAQGSIDPHFCGNPDYLSPVARFEPTYKGWRLAEIVAESMYTESMYD